MQPEAGCAGHEHEAQPLRAPTAGSAPTVTDRTRASLIARVRNPDNAEAWREFDTLYRPMMARFAAAFGLRGPAIEDVVQDCMLALLNHLREFAYDPARGRFRAYLRTAMVHRCITWARARHEALAGSAAFERSQEREPDPIALFDRIHDEELMRHCLAQLSQYSDPIAMRAFQLHSIEQRPMQQVTLETGLSPQQVYKAAFEMRRQLKDLWRIASHDDENRDE